MAALTWFKVCAGRWEVQRPVKIIILGAGQVGGTLAEHLADEQNDITVVDEQTSTLKSLLNVSMFGLVLGTERTPAPSWTQVPTMPICLSR